MEVGGEGNYVPASLHCRHQNDFSIKPVGSDESHFILLHVVRDKVTRQCPQTREKRAEADSNRCPSAYESNALALGHTGSPND